MAETCVQCDRPLGAAKAFCQYCGAPQPVPSDWLDRYVAPALIALLISAFGLLLLINFWLQTGP